jgi:hypothetical protein
VTSHLLDEALRCGARFVCPFDGGALDKQITRTSGRWAMFYGHWGHLSEGQHHITGRYTEVLT